MVSATAQTFSCIHEGVDKTSFIDSLQYLSDQVRQMDQVLAVKVSERMGRDLDAQNQELQCKQKNPNKAV